ncbi:MAG: hypothetical protein IJT96_05445 [Lachnospiraceae bacterium]|nr:hypothetical protein [Lachnospiraceae bacterium]
MTPQEMEVSEINNYSMLQRIKSANKEQENPVLDYEIKVSAARLATLGVNVKDLTL